MSATEFPPFAVTVDLVVLTVRGGELQALVVRRGEEPFKGCLALPGGFVLPSENLAEAAARELQEETGLSATDVHVEQLASYGAPDRDPRMRVVTVAHIALAPDLPSPVAGTDADDAEWQSVSELEATTDLAFDHSQILRDGVERARAKFEYSPLATAFCAPEFTISELRRIYEAVWGVSLDPRNFHRKASKTPGFLEETDRSTTRDGGRPARLYRAGTAEVLYPPILRG